MEDARARKMHAVLLGRREINATGQWEALLPRHRFVSPKCGLSVRKPAVFMPMPVFGRDPARACLESAWEGRPFVVVYA